MKHRIIVYLICAAVFFPLFLFIFVCLHIILEYFIYSFVGDIPVYSGRGTTIFLLVVLVVPTAFAAVLASRAMRWYKKKRGLTFPPLEKRFVYTLLAAYLLTAVFGTPAVQSSNAEWAIQLHASLDYEDKFDRPYVRTYVAVPVLPFVVLSYHEYALEGLVGRGAWDVQAWYLFGVKRLVSFTTWVA